MALDIIFLDGSGAGGGGGDVETGFFRDDTADGGDGGNGAGQSETFTINDDRSSSIIFGDGAGGGGGESAEPAGDSGTPGNGGLAGGGDDVITGTSGNDIIFGDAYNGQDATTADAGLAGILGGGNGGDGGNDGASDGSDAYGATDARALGGSAGDPAEDGQDGTNGAFFLDGSNTTVTELYDELSSNLEAIVNMTYSSTTLGTSQEGEGAGADTLDGGAGDDQLIGNGGGDSFITDMRDDDGTTDTILDYDSSEGDTITIIDESGASIAIDTLYTPDANAATTGTENVGDDGVVYLADGSQLVIKNFQFQNEAPCFVTGTLINTAEGQKAIESLSIGDSVCTTDGQLETIKWIGKRAVAARFAGAHNQPICIQAGALAQGSPARDLYVSPDHALFIDGVLVQAQALVNGSTITQVEMTADFTYYHIELDRHALIFAEGAETETFVDAQARGKFDNAAEFEALYPAAKAVAAMPYPRVKAKRQLPAAIKAKLKQIKTA
ncbi:MAG: Hint domain-containing protein [Pseudomonadota bacterium]|nr:Hint domain-containing protein [Pseudomonadota bacterium]